MLIRITGSRATKAYTGQDQALQGYTAVSDNPAFDISKLSLRAGSAAYVKGKNAGTYAMQLTAGDFVYQDPNAQVSYQVQDGILTITPVPLEIETGSATKVYDGSPLTNREVKVTGLVNGETITVSATGSQTLIGTSSNTCSINWGTVEPTNYTVRQKPGTLTVTGKGGYTTAYGNGSIKRKGTGSSLEFIFRRTQNDEDTFRHFTGILVDGAEVSRDNYTARAGSVVISLKSSYLDTLPAGTHTLTAMFDDGDGASATFSVQDSAPVTPSGTVTPAPLTAKPAPTGDSGRMMLWGALFAAALLGTGIILRFRKRS